ncbi:MAG TPA: SDR family NAD(P)-dependent oxidoreductase, partial [Burkholderiaceae bacterium]|nr:SDR family NAD(P)-dependent oxidoreductase [Burkholderiaceae bacterium]
MKLEEARVLLIGASGGIGQAMALALRRAGAMVMGVGRSEKSPMPMPWVQADLVSEAGVATVAAAAQQGQINVVVLAAGVSAFGVLSQVNVAQMRAALEVNLLAPMLLTQALLPALMTQPRAQLIFVGSVLGRIGLPGFSVYGASKAGLHGFAEGLRRECAQTQVRIQILGPRSTRTRFNAPQVEAYQRATNTAVD